MRSPDLAIQRLHAQHLLKPDVDSPADVVRWFGAVQAQDFPSALYAIGLRMRTATESSVAEAVQRGSIVRTWPMRGTLHFVPPGDARWMVKLLGERQIAKARGYHVRAGLEPEIFRRAGSVLEKILRDGKSMTRAEIYRTLDAVGVRTTGTPRGLFILAFWAQQGLICLGPRRGKQQTFVLLEEWVQKSRELKGKEALAELAGRYFVSHGPATLQDFSWWSGLSIAEAATGLQAARSALVSLAVDGRTYWWGSGEQQPHPPKPDIHLLPPYDEFAVAYKDRRALLDREAAGNALHGLAPCIILDGRVAGTWKRTRRNDSVLVELRLFAPLNGRQHAALENAAKHYGAFLGLPVAMQT